jgi:[acyl-carrier-protein] S-malonyltransferase
MLADGATKVVEVGPGNVLQGLFKKVSKELATVGAVWLRRFGPR